MRFGLALAGILCLVAPAWAQDAIFSTKNRAAIFENQKRLLDTRGTSQYKHSSRLRPENTFQYDSFGPKPYTGSYRGEYYEMALAAARKHGIPEAIFLNLVQQESAWNPNAVSHKGAIGLAQLMPGTARGLRVDPTDPKENLDGGARYLAKQYRKFGTWRLALAAYNAGPKAVKKYKGVPPFKETKNYVRAIWGS